MNIRKIALVAATTLTTVSVALPAIAQDSVSLTIGSGSEGGTYYPLMQEMMDVCSAENPWLSMSHNLDGEGNSVGGSVNNIRGLLNNEIQAGLAQGDYAYLQSRVVPDMERIQALLAFHSEALHWIVPANVQTLVAEAVPASGGFMGIGGTEAQPAQYRTDPNPITSVAQLRNTRIATWGGSTASATVVDQLVALGNEIVTVDGMAEAMSLLNSGQVAAVMQTVGAPASWIEDLPAGQYRLLNVSEGTAGQVSQVYGISGVSYDNMANGGLVNVLTVQATLFTRTYRTEDMQNALATLQACVIDNLYAIQDTAGTHPAWQRIGEVENLTDIRWSNLFEAPAGFTYGDAAVVTSTPAVSTAVVTGDGG